ncbi:hypothetical protein AQI88_10635 [Streptomyces cellostaticus]|uniref:Uncharacterized protein n=1 Tax=Streptomyces cellostaticus TaxID=67285 RepID=A0A101NP91_9ACTN|nr:hypothetical protein [Streptomyces cellostaticus]KUM96925.1 hypothetical protein AQI88_10635 [Streptomyces cellostaticus]GHI05637.1 hypothetical protein Scel_39580 [Streptomyces cellostaticus]
MPAPQGPPAGPEPPPPRSPLSTFGEKVAYFAAPGTVAFALLYYFGSVYVRSYYSALGVVPEDLGMSVQNVVASSTSAIFFPLCVLLAGGLIVFLVFGWLGRALAGPEHDVHRRTAITVLLAVGVAMVLVGLPGLFSYLVLPFPAGWPRIFMPALVVAVGSTLAVCAAHLRLSRSTGVAVRQDPAGDRVWLAVGTLLIGLLTVSLFFDMAQYAVVAGRSDARLDARRGYQDSPFVVIHSRVPLTHHAKNIKFNDHGSTSGPYRYEYLGFRLLAKSPTRFYLVSYASRWKDRRVVVLPDDRTAWLEIRSPG